MISSIETPSPLDENGSHIRQAGHGEAQAGIGSIHAHAFQDFVCGQWGDFFTQFEAEIYRLGVAATNQRAYNAKLCK